MMLPAIIDDMGDSSQSQSGNNGHAREHIIRSEKPLRIYIGGPQSEMLAPGWYNPPPHGSDDPCLLMAENQVGYRTSPLIR